MFVSSQFPIIFLISLFCASVVLSNINQGPRSSPRQRFWIFFNPRNGYRNVYATADSNRINTYSSPSSRRAVVSSSNGNRNTNGNTNNNFNTNNNHNGIDEDDLLDYETDQRLGQYPIDAPIRFNTRRLNESCRFSSECLSRCCLLQRNSGGRRVCTTRSELGERCSVGQIKFDHYVDHCPCSAGDDHCLYPDYVCT